MSYIKAFILLLYFTIISVLWGLNYNFGEDALLSVSLIDGIFLCLFMYKDEIQNVMNKEYIHINDDDKVLHIIEEEEEEEDFTDVSDVSDSYDISNRTDISNL